MWRQGRWVIKRNKRKALHAAEEMDNQIQTEIREKNNFQVGTHGSFSLAFKSIWAFSQMNSSRLQPLPLLPSTSLLHSPRASCRYFCPTSLRYSSMAFVASVFSLKMRCSFSPQRSTSDIIKSVRKSCRKKQEKKEKQDKHRVSNRKSCILTWLFTLQLGGHKALVDRFIVRSAFEVRVFLFW